MFKTVITRDITVDDLGAVDEGHMMYVVLSEAMARRVHYLLEHSLGLFKEEDHPVDTAVAHLTDEIHKAIEEVKEKRETEDV